MVPNWDDTDMYFPEDDPDDEMNYVSAEQRLMNHLLRHYERAVRPVKRAFDTVTVLMGLTLTQIFDMVSTGTQVYCSLEMIGMEIASEVAGNKLDAITNIHILSLAFCCTELLLSLKSIHPTTSLLHKLIVGASLTVLCVARFLHGVWVFHQICIVYC